MRRAGAWIAGSLGVLLLVGVGLSRVGRGGHPGAHPSGVSRSHTGGRPSPSLGARPDPSQLRGKLVYSVFAGNIGKVFVTDLAASIGHVLFTSRGENERLLDGAGLRVLAVEDTTENWAEVARRRAQARANRAKTLRKLEGAERFEGRQRFFDIVTRLASERRLSRVFYVGEKPT